MTALQNELALGLTESEMRQVVLRLSRRDFYKAMTSHADHQVWQDVYHGMTEDGIPVSSRSLALLVVAHQSYNSRRSEVRL